MSDKTNRNINSASEPVKVILADDDKDDQEIFETALEETEVPAELTKVDSGQELMDHLKDPNEPNPDIIFLDLNMPHKGGKEALEEIKKDRELKEIPTVILSTSDHPNDVNDTFAKGANLYIKKPNSITLLARFILKVFSLHWTKKLFTPEKKSFIINDKDVLHDK